MNLTGDTKALELVSPAVDDFLASLPGVCAHMCVCVSVCVRARVCV